MAGNSRDLRPESRSLALDAGDVLVLCTDGLIERLEDAEILDIVHSTASAEEASHELIRAANEAGASDNLTAVVSRFVDSPRFS